jgi:hypothetical protein
MPVRVPQRLGADPNLTEIRGLVCHPDHETAVYRLLLEHRDARWDEWHWVH